MGKPIILILDGILLIYNDMSINNKNNNNNNNNNNKNNNDNNIPLI